jgi:hypothetical protein
VKTLQDHEVFADQERIAIADLEEDLRAPIHLPSPEEVERVVVNFDDLLKRDPETARERMKRWIRGSIKVGPREDGAIVAEGSLLPLMVVEDGQRPKRNLPETNQMVSGRYTVVAGAGFEPATFGL